MSVSRSPPLGDKDMSESVVKVDPFLIPSCLSIIFDNVSLAPETMTSLKDGVLLWLCQLWESLLLLVRTYKKNLAKDPVILWNPFQSAGVTDNHFSLVFLPTILGVSVGIFPGDQERFEEHREFTCFSIRGLFFCSSGALWWLKAGVLKIVNNTVV